MEQMESRMLMSAGPISNVASHNLDHSSVPALVAGTNQGNGTGLAALSSGVTTPNRLLVAKSPVWKAPAAPKFTATPCSASQINLAWAGVSGATNYLVDEWINGAWKQIGSLPSADAKFPVSGLRADTVYFFDVAAQNPAGTTWGVPLAAATDIDSPAQKPPAKVPTPPAP
jgi:hypothetical protein